MRDVWMNMHHRKIQACIGAASLGTRLCYVAFCYVTHTVPRHQKNFTNRPTVRATYGEGNQSKGGTFTSHSEYQSRSIERVHIIDTVETGRSQSVDGRDRLQWRLKISTRTETAHTFPPPFYHECLLYNDTGCPTFYISPGFLICHWISDSRAIYSQFDITVIEKMNWKYYF